MSNNSQINNSRAARYTTRLMLCGSLVCLPLLPAKAQLAITEVQSLQANTPVTRGNDYWELTNFSSNSVDLANYWFSDDGGNGPRYAQNLATLLPTRPWIGPGESLIFANLKAGVLTNSANFRQWWGESKLRSDLEIVASAWGFGLNSEKDEVQLWYVTPEETRLADRVALLHSDAGDSFTYDQVTGLLDRFSIGGVDHAFRSATSADIGSPGVTTGPVPLQVVEAPMDLEVDAGSPVTLTVRAFGLPRPHYQWYFYDEPIAGATTTNLAIANAGDAHVGEYSVAVSNGLTNVVTSPAFLRVNFTPSCAAIVQPPEDTTVTPWQTAVFRVTIRGYPLPDIQWQFNGSDLPGENSTTLFVWEASEPQAGTYTVQVRNSGGATNASAQLRVVPAPKLIITEAMTSPSTNTTVTGHGDWWELTNTDTNSVNLRGYRFDDNSFSLTGGFTVTNDVIVSPGESVIWVSSMSPEAFKRWWGEENLPEGLQIISYPGNGFTTLGDAIMLWNATALTVDEYLTYRDFVNLTPGVTLWFDPVLAEYGKLSVENERGAFRAAESDDIGSPGWTTNEQRIVRPRVSIQRDPTGLRLTWKTEPGRSYRLEHRSDPARGIWTTLVELFASESTLTTVDSEGGFSQRFYRVVRFSTTP